RRLSRLTASSGLQETISLSITDGVTPERVQADSVTSGVFTTLRVPALLGRVFNENDERPGHTAVAIISEGFWRRRFAGDPAVIGRSLQIDGRAHEIVGVLPSHMRYPNEGVVLWLPLELSDADPVPGSLRYESVSRLRTGVTREAAEREYIELAARGSDFFSVAAPGISMAKWLELVKPRPTLRPLRDEMVGDIGPVLWVMLGTIAFVLLAACTNIATLFLVRAESRQRELAVRGALGAGRLDAIARFFSEGLIVAVTGAVIGSLGAYVAIGALRRSSTFPVPRLGEIDLDGTVLLVTIGITLLVALFTSALPILRFGRRDLSPILRSGGRSATAGNDRRRVRGALVTTQVALAFVLLAASTLMARSFLELRQVQPGFDVDRVEAFRLSLPTATYVGDTVITQLYERLNAQLSAIPGVERVGIASWLPLENEGSSLSTAFREGAPPAEQETPPTAPQVLASATYFKAVGIPFVVGRTFRQIPIGSRSDEVVVSRAFAQQSLGGGELSSAIGKRLKFLPQGPWLTIVGVVGD
ncbi:MAG: ABC transporter permease, partial [Gemmatimonadaceae bacterium]